MSFTAEKLLEYLPDGVILGSPEGTVDYLNAAAEHMLGRSASRAIGLPLEALLEGASALLELAQAALSSRDVGTFQRHGLPTGARAKGLRVDAAAVRAANGAVVLTLRDRTLASDLEQAERRDEKLSGLEAIAAGIAHEVKNPLGGMRGAAQLLGRTLAEDDERREYVDVLLREVDRVADLIDRLRNLAHPPPPSQQRPVDVNRLLHEIVLLQDAAVSENDPAASVGFDLRFDPSLPAVPGDPAALKQALLNLVQNACEATPAGEAPVRIGTAVATGMIVRRPDGRRRPLIQIEIADRGHGLDAEALKKIFTPFYTSKATGTGLGLPTAQRIVTAHGGTISVETEETRGTRFIVTLPAISPTEPMDTS